MLVDSHCHIDRYPQPNAALAAGQEAGILTLAVSTSLASYVRTRILCRQYPGVTVALGLHPSRVGAGYDQWAEWQRLAAETPFIGEVGLAHPGSNDLSSSLPTAKGRDELKSLPHGRADKNVCFTTLHDIAALCAKGPHLLSLHAPRCEAEAWEALNGFGLRHVIWHGFRGECPRSLLFRTVEAGHYLGLGPEAAQSATLAQRLRGVPRDRVLTETDGPEGLLGVANRAAALRAILANLAPAWGCTPEQAETQVEENWRRLLTNVMRDP
jgi:TatD DNase family protein